MQYLTFAEYTDLGGTVTDETTFNSLQRQLESKMNYLTFGRLDKEIATLEGLAETVKTLEVDLINTYSTSDVNVDRTGVQSYSNGIESITYAVNNDNIEKQRNAKLNTTLQTYLWNYPQLFYRGRR